MGAFLSPLQIADVIESDQSAFERQSDVIRLVQRELIDVRATLRAQKQTMVSMQGVINDIERNSNRCARHLSCRVIHAMFLTVF